MAKPKLNKFNVDMAEPAPERIARRAPAYERHETRGPGRPIGKRSNPAFKQYTVLMRIDTHDRAIDKLREHMRQPDFGEYVENLVLKDLGKAQ